MNDRATENKEKLFWERSLKNPRGKLFGLISLFIVMVTGGVLIYGTMDMPGFSDPKAPAHRHVAPRYIEKGLEETGVPNLVTAILASYRGYDTLGETLVIFTAGLSVILLLRRADSR